jgi:hypothetical protein
MFIGIHNETDVWGKQTWMVKQDCSTHVNQVPEQTNTSVKRSKGILQQELKPVILEQRDRHLYHLPTAALTKYYHKTVKAGECAQLFSVLDR